MSWHIRGSYFESCNCDVICPCRRIDGVPGGRSTHGFCVGALSWLLEEGAADGTDLSGLAVALAFHYSDDVPRSPWSWILYLDERASGEQRDALTEHERTENQCDHGIHERVRRHLRRGHARQQPQVAVQPDDAAEYHEVENRDHPLPRDCCRIEP